MTTPLDDLATRPGAALIDTASLDAFLTAPGAVALLFSGIRKGRMEAQDVAVAMREILRAHAGSLRVGVIDPAAEDALRTRFGVNVLPAVVVVEEGEAREVLPRVQDWAVYEAAFRRVMPNRAAAA